MQDGIDYKNIKKIGLVTRPLSNLDAEISSLRALLEARGVELLLFRESSKREDLVRYDLDELFQKSDFVISLGGDGTLISLCKKAFEFDRAILAMNAGKLGFLTDFCVAEAGEFLGAFFEGDFRVERPLMLELILEDEGGRIWQKNAFNDAVFFRELSHSMAHIELFREGKKFNEYFGDGLIVATPIGSTAYNLSANGPIIYTLAEVFVLTPVCSHSLTQRSIVLPQGFELEVRAKDCVLCVDGQKNYAVNDFKSIKVRLSDKGVRLIRPKNRDYFQILKEKLSWGK
ncbi:NAD(+) kinase [Campylobacter sp.]|uniref:NAD(+) kinase n=1 Tax=Campylobacter sp. TaxID=205 RepID=UPI0026DAF1E7|nr:NAD(+) kinase [Campylobacter sp.]MDO4674396.1 NAD(+) kinase [Campylobacter sp.]